MLEKHILEAQAKALAHEEKEYEKRKNICNNPDEFGVPPSKLMEFFRRIKPFKYLGLIQVLINSQIIF